MTGPQDLAGIAVRLVRVTVDPSPDPVTWVQVDLHQHDGAAHRYELPLEQARRLHDGLGRMLTAAGDGTRKNPHSTS